MKRIFIVGHPRSGTTLLQSLLGVHTKLLTFTESHFFRLNYLNIKRRTFVCLPKKEIKQNIMKFLLTNHFSEDVKRYFEKYANKQLSGISWAAFFFSLLDNEAYYKEKEGWVEKTPGHVRNLHIIRRILPDAIVFHMVRDPIENIASVYNLSKQYPSVWGNLSLKTYARMWKRNFTISVNAAKKRNNYIIKLDELIENHNEIITTIFSILGLSTFDNYHTREDILSNVIQDDEPWKIPTHDKIRKQESKYLLSTDEQEMIRTIVNENEYRELETIGINK